MNFQNHRRIVVGYSDGTLRDKSLPAIPHFLDVLQIVDDCEAPGNRSQEIALQVIA